MIYIFCPFVQTSKGHLDEQSASMDTYVRPKGELVTAHFDFKVAHKGGEP